MTRFILKIVSTIVFFGMLGALPSTCLVSCKAAAQDTQTSKVVVVVLDDSGSMKKPIAGQPSRLAAAKVALQRVIQTLSPDTQLGILLLNGAKSHDGWLVPLGNIQVEDALRRVQETVADGGTPLGSGMLRASVELLKFREKNPYGDYRLLVVTDGEATDAEVLQKNLPHIISRGIVLDVIGVDMQGNHSLARRSHSYRRANDAESFEKAVKEVFAESAFDANTNNQADFDLLAALPDDLASQALQTMRGTGQASLDSGSNGGASSKATTSGSVQPNLSAAASSNATNPNAAATNQSNSLNPNSSSSQPQRNSSPVGKLFFVLLVVFIFVLLRGLAGHKRR